VVPATQLLIYGDLKWQDAFEALPRPITPTLFLTDGYVSRGLGALTRLIELREVANDEQQ
jgi:hypothetical protein